jgi:hypothetical protein
MSSYATAAWRTARACSLSVPLAGTVVSGEAIDPDGSLIANPIRFVP